MDRSAHARKRRQAPGQPTTKPPVRLSRDKKDVQKPREAKSSLESNPSARRVDSSSQRPSVETDPNARTFSVRSVGRNGTLYLKPSRAPTNQFTQPPATPPSTAGENGNEGARAAEDQSGTASGMMTPRAAHINAGPATHEPPPPSMLNAHNQKRTRSLSLSTIDDAIKAQPVDATQLQILLNGQRPGQRPKSSVDLSEGLANFRIPHYRLGTPRFSVQGTAYLHNSIHSSMTEDLHSSVLSRTEFDRFPAPPGRDTGLRFGSRYSSGAYLQPSHATSSVVSSRTPRRYRGHKDGRIDLALYDHIEANIHDPSLVRYSVATGRIMAATPARLIAQITSPWFLDYELLSNFFLTYRNFLISQDLLDHLLVRMNWALANGSDAGRIVTVRTFVALRHWILNYFADDFLPDFGLRQKFCNLVNEIAYNLQRRPDKGGGDLNVIGELKKCWRRICAMFWPVDDFTDASPLVEIEPGEDEDAPQVRASATSFMQSGQYDGTVMDFRRSSVIQLPPPLDIREPEEAVAASSAHPMARVTRVVSIPATPASDQSLTVLSCAVPFLRHMTQTRGPEPTLAPRHNRLRKERPFSEKSTGSVRKHQRSASFTDALRDERAPLPSARPESVDLESLPTASFTGGLVRGLLLQPSPSNVDLLIPLSPPLDTQVFDFAEVEATPVMPERDRDRDRDRKWQNPNVGVKKAVGDVRRVLSQRKSPASGTPSDSSGSRSSGQSDRVAHPASWQQLSGPPRVDLLAEKLEDSYREAFQEMADIEIAPPLSPDPRRIHDTHLSISPMLKDQRSPSHVTTGSRSIVIVDDTGLPVVPAASGPLPPLTPRSRAIAPKPLFGVSPELPQGFSPSSKYTTASSPAVGARGPRGQMQNSPEMPMHDLLAVPGLLGAEPDLSTRSPQARKSSNVHPLLDVAPMRNQLRRRPGGDLKVADNVHDLARSPRPDTSDSYSTFSQAILSSGEPSVDFSNVKVIGKDESGLQMPLSFLQGRKKDSWTLLPTHSSQPNMRPSMKAKVSHLAKLPDDTNDGGIEDALAKLEGKTASPTASTNAIAASPKVLAQDQGRGPAGLRIVNPAILAQDSPVTDSLQSPNTDRQGASIYRMSDSTYSDPNASGMHSGFTGLGISSDPQAGRAQPQDGQLTDLSEQAVAVLNARGAVAHGQASSDSQRSFLLDDTDSLSDISTEIAEEEDLGVRSFYFDDTIDDDVRRAAPFRPRPPPTPPSTGGASQREGSSHHSLGPVEPKSLKSAISPPQPLKSNPPAKELWPHSAEMRRSLTVPSRRHTAHLPFVLAFESDVIAEQLTIIEKDALDEVDWKDLIGLKWQHTALQIRNWVEFLKRDDCNGIDIVVSRFNLVVKWVVSECILTEAPSERARCISKYIHIAAHAHRLRNYATLYQITLALLSSDMSRLHKTWALVSPQDKQLLARLEKLCQPRGNFHQLRLEMESAPADDACIPFIGLYTHDLMFNAQKPARIDPSPPGGEPLVNFERYQTAAAIVKSLLTLVEASARYVFRPHPEVLSRCLWLAALPDCEITSRSKGLEKEA